MCRFNKVNGHIGGHTHTSGIVYAVAGSPNQVRYLEVCSNRNESGKMCGVVASEDSTLGLASWLKKMRSCRARRVVMLGGDRKLIRACGARPFDRRAAGTSAPLLGQAAPSRA